MSSGRKKSKNKIKAPPPITRTEYNLPTGDNFTTSTEGGTQRFTSSLSGATSNLVRQSQSGLETLAKELRRPSSQRARDIRKRGDDFFDLQAESINENADDLFKRTQSNLNQRFKGSLNSTFGSDLLSKVEDDRLNRLMRSRKESNLLAEDLFKSDEDSRVRRFALFQNYLSDINNQARGLASQGSNVLSSERARATKVAIAEANLEQRDRQLQDQIAARRFNAVKELAFKYLDNAKSMATAGAGAT